ncbi:MAG: hypothetical protein OEV06_09160, partial [Anaerolineae bacterium]|nr:hypothetical protein [Anaerolineae bacterium]
IFPGPIPDRDIVAAPWTPSEDLAGPDGRIPVHFIWAALDCPGAFAFGRDGDPLVLGTMAAEVIAPLDAGEECLVIGWPRRVDGRKLYSGTALFSISTGLVARAAATWIMLDSLDQLK